MIFLLKEDIGDYSFPGERTVAMFDIGNKTSEQVLIDYRNFIDNIVEKEYIKRSKNDKVYWQLRSQTLNTWSLVKFLTEKLQLKELIYYEHFI